jgi:hypothetical protein
VGDAVFGEICEKVKLLTCLPAVAAPVSSDDSPVAMAGKLKILFVRQTRIKLKFIRHSSQRVPKPRDETEGATADALL